MATQEVEVTIKLVGADGFKKDVEGALGSVNESAKESQGSLGSLGNIAKSALGAMAKAAVAAGTVAAGALGAITVSGVKTAASLETAKQGFITLLGSAQEADEVIEQIKKDAKTTPFDLVGLVQANQLLTAVTKDGRRSQKILMDVGKALGAMGKGQEELDRIIVNLQQIGAVGKASMLDIRQFAFAGIPIYDLLSSKFENVNEAISEGKVTLEVLEEVFASASAEGGRFATAFSDQAGTWNQQIANLKDSWAIFASDFVKNTGIFDAAKNALSALGSFLEEWGPKTIGIFNNVKESIRQSIGDFLNNPAVKKNLEETKKLWAEVLDGIRDGWSTVTSIYRTELKPALDDLWVVMQEVMGGFEVSSKRAFLFGQVLAGLIGGVVLFWSWMVKIYTAVLRVATEFDNAKKSVTNFVNSPAMQTLLKTWNFLTNPGGTIIDAVKSRLPSSSQNMSVDRNKADGGIVGGSSYFGDKILTPINSGEMVINRSQQAALFNLLKNLGTQPRVNINSLNMSSTMASPMQQGNDLINLLGMI